MRHQKNFLPIFIILCGIAIAVPLVVFADHPNGTHLIVCATHYNFIGPPPAGQAPSTPFCNICDLLVLVQTAFNFVWTYLTIPIATVMFLYGGFLMILPSFTGNTNQATKGRKVLLNTVLGLAIVFFAWIGVDSILKIMGAQQSGNFGPWNKIVCDEEAAKIKFIGGPVDVIPAELACPAGVTTHIVNGENVCDNNVQRSMVTHTSLNGARFNNCAPANIEPSVDSIIRTAARQNNINVNRFRALILAESSGNRNVPVSSRGACGMAQVLPTTAGQSCAALRDPQVGIPAGAVYYASRLRECRGNEACAAAAYNGGPAANSPSRDCDGMTRYQCPFDNRDHTIRNTGYEPTRNYVNFLNSCQTQLGG